MITRQGAEVIAAKTQDAYSFSAYGINAWFECCRMLARRGYDEEGIEEIMRSKWTRWAGDGSEKNNYGRYTSKDLERFLDRGDGITPENWKQVMRY